MSVFRDEIRGHLIMVRGCVVLEDIGVDLCTKTKVGWYMQSYLGIFDTAGTLYTAETR